jgi:plastocyanin
VSALRALALAATLVVGSACVAAGSGVAPSPASSVRTASPALLIPTAAPTLRTTARISIGDNFFAPDEVTVAVGATVVWQIDAGENPHDVIASDGSFGSSSPMNRGDTFSHTFTKAGEYAYVCSFHIVEHMVGKVIVK